MIVKVTQYYRPNGRQETHELEVNDECRANYDEICKIGRLTCEQMMNGTVSQTIETDEEDYDIILTSGKSLAENLTAIETMILRFDPTAYAKHTSAAAQST